MIADAARSANSWNAGKQDDIELMHITVVVIEKLDRKIELLKNEINNDNSNDPMKRKYLILKLNALEKCLAKAYKSLDEEEV